MQKIIIPDLTIPSIKNEKYQKTSKYLKYHYELEQVEEQIRRLKIRANELRHLRKEARIEEKYKKLAQSSTTPLKLYILELEDGKYYVGQSRDVQRRFKKHFMGKGANWTRLHKPIRIIQVVETGLTSSDEVAKLEDRLTLETAIQYGIENVRGGGYCQSKPKWPQGLYDEMMGLKNY